MTRPFSTLLIRMLVNGLFGVLSMIAVMFAIGIHGSWISLLLSQSKDLIRPVVPVESPVLRLLVTVGMNYHWATFLPIVPALALICVGAHYLAKRQASGASLFSIFLNVALQVITALSMMFWYGMFHGESRLGWLMLWFAAAWLCVPVLIVASLIAGFRNRKQLIQL